MYWVFAGFVLGVLFGSFANVLIYRLPLGRGGVFSRSRCPFCGVVLGAGELIPVFSWVLQRGRCRSCGERISWRYPFVEILCGILFGGMVVYLPSASVIPLFVFAFVLVVVGFIDFDTQIIYDEVLLFGAAAGVIWILLGNISWHSALIGMLAGALPLIIIDRLVILLVKKDGFGGGDVKLMAVAGLFLGWELVIVAFFFAFVSGGLLAIGLFISGRAERGSYIAFGPFLCAGVLAALWFEDRPLSFIFLWI